MDALFADSAELERNRVECQDLHATVQEHVDLAKVEQSKLKAVAASNDRLVAALRQARQKQ